MNKSSKNSVGKWVTAFGLGLLSIQDTRRELAHHYLEHSTVELNEAAFLLGYEDANSFFRAFQGWEGTSPGEWRTRHRTVEAAGHRV